MTHLRKMMLEELERRNYAQTTTRFYIQRGLLYPCGPHISISMGGHQIIILRQICRPVRI
jgi:hypothetical protein